MRKIVITCETVNCQNFGIGIEMITDANQYGCGACGLEIFKVEEVIDGQPETE